MPSGRPLLTIHTPDEDTIYTRTQTVVSAVSWLLPMGLYPVYSEASGRVRPVATWLIVAVTVIVSGWFWYRTEVGEDPAVLDHMLWSADRQTVHDQIVRETQRESPDLSVQEINQSLREQEVYVPGYEHRQLVSHAFLHADLLHLAGNMLFLLVIGTRVNNLIGNTATLGSYLLLAALAGIAWRMQTPSDQIIPMLGASGAIMGLCGMYLVLLPLYKVYMVAWWRWGLIGKFRLSHKVFPMPGYAVVLFYIAWDVLWLVLGAETGVAHWAHLGGMMAGAALALVLLATRLVYTPGNAFSLILGKYAWSMVGKPREGQGLLTAWIPSPLRSRR
ncbi:MAG TPA: rhomboid family intramembrane serine protease [Phycisphaerae bacterium]|nr:rhomboid family intramembrane serine protease [Phycisphaerae bacterium]